MIIRDRNGLERHVEDGQPMTIYNGTIPVDGHVMIFKENAWLKTRRRGSVELLMFERYNFSSTGQVLLGRGSQYLPHTSWQEANDLPTVPLRSPDDWRSQTEPKWEIGACYEHPLQTESYLKLVHMAGDWVTFEKYAIRQAATYYKVPEGTLIGVHSSRKSEKANLKMTTPAPKHYDPKQQPYTEDDI